MAFEPAIKIVAALAIGRREGRASAGVRRIGGALPVFQMAGIALRGKAVEDSGGQLLVTFVALHCGVCAQKREAVLVILHLLNGNIPTLYGVTLCAVGTHLAAMNVGVAIGAILSDIGEDRLDVARDALHVFVHATQGIVGLVVIEFRNGADGSPTGGGVTVLAGDRQRTVRITGGFLLGSAEVLPDAA